MSIQDDLQWEIGNDLNIKKGCTESEDSYIYRLIYSALGHIALGSLYEYESKDTIKKISIKRFKDRIQETYLEYLKIFPNMNTFFSVGEKSLSDEIYNIYLNTGYFYHLSNNISQSIYSEAIYNGIKFIRGNSLSNKVHRSGLGAYLKVDDNSCDFDKIVNMFHLHKNKLSDYWKYFIEQYGTKKLDNLPDNIEYLRTIPQNDKIWGRYWIDKPDNNISLARETINHKIYYLFFERENKGVELPSFLIKELFIDENKNGNEYLYLANSLLASLGRLPKIKYKFDGDIVEFGDMDRTVLYYLLPPAELNLIKLYSWRKCIFDKKNDKFIFDSFNYIIDKNVFKSIKELFEKLGYEFEESEKVEKIK